VASAGIPGENYGAPGDPYSIIDAPASINNSNKLEWVGYPSGNDDGKCDPGEECIPQVAFSGFDHYRYAHNGTDLLSTPVRLPLVQFDQGSYNNLGVLFLPLFPMIADDGSIVVR